MQRSKLVLVLLLGATVGCNLSWIGKPKRPPGLVAELPPPTAAEAAPRGPVAVVPGGVRLAALTEQPSLASRTSGVAPLAVHFDAGGHSPIRTVTGASFLTGRYVWDFGDPSSGNWPLSGRPKNAETGPIAGHVYETPGTYVATLNGTDQVTITVQDPNVVFAGASTICLAQNGDFTGAPAGSTQLTTSSWSTLVGQLAAGRRVLLRRGETWTATSTISSVLQGPGIVGAFGTGSRPKINHTLQVFGPEWNDWRIMDLELDGLGNANSRAFRAQGPCTNLLIFRCRAFNTKTGFTFSTSQIVIGEAFSMCSIVECEAGPIIGGSGGYASMFAGSDMLFLGNNFQNTSSAEHILRAHHLTACVVAHCDLGLPAATKHVIKMHGLPFTGTGYGAGTRTERILIAHNTIRPGLASWAVAISPEDDHTDQRQGDVIVEGNTTVGPGSMQNAYQLSVDGLMARNNLVNGTGNNSCTGFSVGRRGVEPAPQNLTFLHNTVYTADNDTFRVVTVSGSVAGVIVQGNLGSAPGSSNEQMLNGSGTAVGNILSDSAGFVSPGADFHLLASSAAKDAAVPHAAVWDDLTGYARPAGLAPDVGAYEFVEGPPPPLDQDGDGVLDTVDNCPAVSNANQTDTDQDGMGDACDACPGDPQNDADADGVCGTLDNCPGVANTNQANADGDAFGDVCDACPQDPANDIDQDGRCADVDNCPAIANSDQANMDGDPLGDACDPCPVDPENDVDQDTLCANVDNCPLVANQNQANADADSLGDACDACPMDAQNDVDEDGICGNVDNCPTVANPGQEDNNQDGVGSACCDL